MAIPSPVFDRVNYGLRENVEGRLMEGDEEHQNGFPGEGPIPARGLVR